MEIHLVNYPQLRPATLPGPTGLIVGEPTDADLVTAIAIAAYYTAPAATEPVEFTVTGLGTTRSLSALPADPAAFDKLRL